MRVTERRRMRARPHWWISVGQAMVMLPVVRVTIWAKGYRRTMGLLGLRVPNVEARADAAEPAEVPEDVAEVASAVSAVARLVPFRSRCLARSITLAWLCRRRGHGVDVLIGVAPPEGARLPAHAWAEYRGVPLNDTPDVRDRYGVISP